MRVGLLTLPLDTNYGGILQLAALYRFLTDSGMDAVHLRKRPRRPLWYIAAAEVLRRVPGQNIMNVRATGKARAVHRAFISRFIPAATSGLQVSSDFRRALREHRIDAVVVGSDQVWRLEYHSDNEPLIYFLDFAHDPAMRRISYAASFGRDHWAYPDLRDEVTQHLARFHAVSVREASGVEICRASLGRGDAAVVLDPTMLVDRSFYDEAMAAVPPYQGRQLVTYVLDGSAKVTAAVDAVTAALGAGLDRFSLKVGPADRLIDIPQWLRAIHDAEFVITDSFHGTVFSILFHKRFVVVPNVERGLDRFTSLLDQLGLGHRMITDGSSRVISELVSDPIDYAAVEARLAPLRKYSADFLLSALGQVDRGARE